MPEFIELLLQIPLFLIPILCPSARGGLFLIGFMAFEYRYSVYLRQALHAFRLLQPRLHQVDHRLIHRFPLELK
jgi:hypothetical protein